MWKALKRYQSTKLIYEYTDYSKITKSKTLYEATQIACYCGFFYVYGKLDYLSGGLGIGLAAYLTYDRVGFKVFTSKLVSSIQYSSEDKKFFFKTPNNEFELNEKEFRVVENCPTLLVCLSNQGKEFFIPHSGTWHDQTIAQKFNY